MGIGVEGYADLRVSEDFHDDASRNALSEEDAGRRVSQVMHSNGTQSSLPDYRAKRPVIVPWMYRGAEACSGKQDRDRPRCLSGFARSLGAPYADAARRARMLGWAGSGGTWRSSFQEPLDKIRADV